MTVEATPGSPGVVPPTGGTPTVVATPGTDVAARAAVVAPGGDPAAAAPAAVAAPAVSLTIGDETPVVAEVTPPVVDTKVEVSYNPTGNPGLDMALTFVGKLGIKADSPAMVAAEAGDFSILKAQLSTMGDKARGWEAHVALGEKGFSDLKVSIETKKAADTKAIHDAVGGADNWTAVKKFAADATADTPHEREALNSLLSAGGLQAKIAASYLAGLWQAAKATAPNQDPAAVLPASQATAASAPTNGALSPRQYTAEVSKLNAKLRGRIDGSPEYQALKDRRALWRETR